MTSRIAPVTPEDRAKLLDPAQPAAPELPPNTEGTRFAIRLGSAYFVTDPDRNCVELHDPIVHVSEVELWDDAPLVALLESIVDSGRPILVAAPAIRGDALALLQINHLRGRVTGCAIDAPLATLRAIGKLGPIKRAIVVESEIALAT